ncbi:hypothetical protein QF042_001445 [Pedobacter sp. W3I1]|nr:hypothetical protein [Pedobacter sp. W3I1]
MKRKAIFLKKLKRFYKTGNLQLYFTKNQFDGKKLIFLNSI